MAIELILPLPPSLNQLMGHTRTGQTYKKPEHRKYFNQVQQTLNIGRIKPFQKDVYLEVKLYVKRKIDIDNYLKTLCDALSVQRLKVGKKTVGFTEYGLYLNDHQICKLSVERHYGDPKVEVRCEEIL